MQALMQLLMQLLMQQATLNYTTTTLQRLQIINYTKGLTRNEFLSSRSLPIRLNRYILARCFSTGIACSTRGKNYYISSAITATNTAQREAYTKQRLLRLLLLSTLKQTKLGIDLKRRAELTIQGLNTPQCLRASKEIMLLLFPKRQLTSLQPSL